MNKDDEKRPTEALLLRFGKAGTIRTLYGKSIPISSSSLNTEGEPAGWGRIEVREDGIWLTDIKWNKVEAIIRSSGLPVYLVPAFTVIGDTAVEILSASLTTTPSDPNATRVS
jgi:hypothetical protein